MSPETIQKVVVDYFAATRSMDLDAWLATFAQDAISHEPGHEPPLQGHAALSQFFQGIAGAVESVGLKEDHIFINGNKAAVKWTGHGVGKNGVAVMFEGIDVFEINESGKIQTVWGYWNPAAMLAQLQA